MTRAPVLHPFLFALFPVLFLFSRNMHLFDVGVIYGPAVVSIGVALIFWFALSLALKDRRKAGLVVSLLFLLFFSYESSYDAVEEFMRTHGVSRVWTQRYLLVIWAIVFAAATLFVIRTSRRLRNVTNMSNVVAGALVAMSVMTIGAEKVTAKSTWRGVGSAESVEANPSSLDEAITLPNIYYIIFDGYAGADILEEVYQHDNSDFLQYLSSKGFFVAGESRSNYMQTTLSLASSMNLKYLDDLLAQVDTESSDRAPLIRMIWDSAVVRFLKEYGYTTVAFPSGWFGTELRGADIYLAPRWNPDEFQNQLIGMTPIPFVVKQLGGPDGYALHRERILYTFEGLVDTCEFKGPIFVFAHLITPHPPFVFDRDGHELDPDYRFSLSDGSQVITKRKLTREEYVTGYREQLIFINSKIEWMVDGILSRSPRPVVIILQADTGPGSLLDYEDPDNTYLKERFSILNAYYLPDGDQAGLYESMSPVNSFRVVLNQYFGTNHELLEDRSYFAPYGRPFMPTDVTERVNSPYAGQGAE